MNETPESQLLGILNGVAKNNQPETIQIGKVLAPPPNIKVQYKDFLLEKEDVWISEYLLIGYERTAKGVIKSETQPRSGGGGYALFASHTHEINNPYTDNIIYTDTLKPGDYVSIMPIQQVEGTTQQYIILDKIVHL
ncbi:DUF2577 domain-containing protein [Veillonella parvula]|uniref:DUF2577 domain-containing protein n=1 Tax=Veillonella parvula TaxID=29466 RepID=UPI00241CCF38|nr:DUF2577 domain-containing protein [Veillonella parvula]MBS6140064.1 DUF2577 domain-containing protein [Veillonella parvula]